MSDSFQLKAIITAVDKMSPVLKGITRSVKGVHKSFRDIGTAGGDLMSKVGIPAGLAFLGVSYGAKEAVRAMLDYGGALQDAADRTGMAVDMLQALRWNAGLAGVEAGELDASMVRLNKALAAGAMGDEGMRSLFAAMKVPMRDAHHQIRALGDVLPEIAESFRRTENPAVRTRMAMSLFGKEGTKLVPMLALGKAGINDLMKEAERLGITLDKGAVVGLDEMGDALFTLKSQLRGTFGSVIAEATKSITPLLDSLKEWIAANKDLIRTNISKGIEQVVGWVKSVDWRRVGNDIKSVWTMIVGFVEAMGGVRSVVIALGVALAAGPVASILSIGGAILRLVPLIFGVVKAFTLFALANPVVLSIVLIVGALGAAAYVLYENWGAISAWWGRTWKGIKQAAFVAWDWISSAFLNFSPLGLIIKNWSPIVEFFKGLWGALETMLPDWLKNMFTGNSSVNVSGGMPAGAARSPIASMAAPGARQQLQGEVRVSFDNAPPGVRVDQGRSSHPGVEINTDVGYRPMMAY